MRRPLVLLMTWALMAPPGGALALPAPQQQRRSERPDEGTRVEVIASAPCAGPTPQPWDGGPLPTPAQRSVPTPVPTPEGLDVPLRRLIALAREPRYEQLLRDPDAFRGQLLHLTGQVLSVRGDDELGYQLLIAIERDGAVWTGAAAAAWVGPRLLSGDVIDFVAIGGGTVENREKDGVTTIPAVDIIRVRRVLAR